MCTPPRRNPVPPLRPDPARPAAVPVKASKTVEGHCRWIDHSGLEWLFTRAGGTLIVERPNARGSVAIRFPGLGGGAGNDAAKEAWVLVEIEDGKVFHCGVSSAAHSVSETTSPGPMPHLARVNRSVRTWFDSAEPMD